MKRMTIREIRANISKVQEPVEVVRYHETLGYFIPAELMRRWKGKKVDVAKELDR